MTAPDPHRESHVHSCCEKEEAAAKEPAGACCSGNGDRAREHQPGSDRGAKYFCPMCPGVESERPGSARSAAWRWSAIPRGRKQPPLYTCPMHPEIEQDHPGTCPKCGMALEPKTVAAASATKNAELRDMTRRFWIGAALDTAGFFLAMAHLVPGRAGLGGERCVALDAICAQHAGGACGRAGRFSSAAGTSLVHRHLNMFTLIAMGVGVAWVYSAVVMLAPGLFPAVLSASRKDRHLF